MEQENSRSRSDFLEARERGLVLLLTVVALVIRLIRLDYRGMWTDEFHTLNAVLLPWRELFLERVRAGHLPTYFIFMKWWVGVFGTSDIALRLPSALVGCLIVPAIAYFAKPWFSRPVMWTLIGIACINGTAVWSSQEARMYSMLLVASVYSHGAFLRAIAQGEKKAWVIYLCATLIAVALQPVMILSVVAHCFIFFRESREKIEWQRTAAWIIGSLLFITISVLVGIAMIQEKREIHFDSDSVHDFLKDVVHNGGLLVKRMGLIAFGVSADTGNWRALTSVVLFAMLGQAAYAWRQLRRHSQEFTASPEAFALRVCTGIVLIPSLPIFLSAFFLEHVIGNERYMIPVTVPLWTLAVWGVFQSRGRWRDVLAVSGILLLLTGFIRHTRDRGLGGREIVYYVNRHANAGDAIVFRMTPTMKLMIEHYSARQFHMCAVPEPSTKLEITGEEIVRRLRECLRGHRRFWLIEYRGKGSYLSGLVSERPEEFSVLKKITEKEARAILIERKTLE